VRPTRCTESVSRQPSFCARECKPPRANYKSIAVRGSAPLKCHSEFTLWPTFHAPQRVRLIDVLLPFSSQLH